MATLTQVNIIVTDTASLTADDAANIVQQILAILRSRTLSIVYASSEPSAVITVS